MTARKPTKVYVKQEYGFVGWRGQSVRLAAGDEYNSDDPIVLDMPDHFTTADQETRARRARRG